MDKVIPEFEESIFNLDSDLSELLMDYAEIGIDSIIDDSFQKIPIIRLVAGIGQAAQNLHDRNMLKQTLAFIYEFNNNKILEENIKEYKERIDSSAVFAEEELGRVLVLLNGTVDSIKSKFLARFFAAYVDKKINWNKFCELSDVCSRIFVSDIELLKDVYLGKVSDTCQCEDYRADRLISLGLLDSATKRISHRDGVGKTYYYVHINSLGRLFCELTQ